MPGFTQRRASKTFPLEYHALPGNTLFCNYLPDCLTIFLLLLFAPSLSDRHVASRRRRLSHVAAEVDSRSCQINSTERTKSRSASFPYPLKAVKDGDKKRILCAYKRQASYLPPSFLPSYSASSFGAVVFPRGRTKGRREAGRMEGR